jgi:PmbA protein
MFNPNISMIGENVVRIAKAHNCITQVTIVEKKSRDISVRKGEIENILSSSTISTGVRLFKGKKSSMISFSGCDFSDIDIKIKKALKELIYLEDDESKRLLNEAEFGNKVPNVELDDDGYDHIGPAEAVNILKKIEEKALAFSPQIIPSEKADFSQSRSKVSIFSSLGLHKSYHRSHYFFSYTAVAKDKQKGNKEIDSYHENKRFFLDLSNLENIGGIAADRALRKIGGRKIKSSEMKVIFSHRSAPSVLDLLFSSVKGEAILLRNSFLIGRLGKKIFPDHITIEDNPLMHRYLGSYPFDGEGMNGREKLAVDRGKLLTYLHNSYSAEKLRMKLTGNASLPLISAPGIESGNFFLRPGKGSLDDLAKEMKNGLLIEELFLSGMNAVTGDFSFGCSGFMIEGGAITHPVKEITVAGNLLNLFKNIIAIADDNQWKYAISSPSFLVAKINIGGI